MEKLSDFSVQRGFVRDVTMEDVAARKERLNKVDGMKSTSFPRQAVRIFQNPNSCTRSNNRIPNLGMESVRDESVLRNKEGLNDDGHAGSYSYSHAGKSSIPTSFGESTFVSTMNPSGGNPIDVEEEAWSFKATGGVDGPTGAQSGMFPSLVEVTKRPNASSSNDDKNKRIESVGLDTDLVSSSLKVMWVPGTTNVVDLLGVPLNTLGDIDNLTKDIELGKVELWSDLPSEKRMEVMETIWAMWDAFVAENPNLTSS
uniref:Uncharacterized protein n=1 Tax=Tanacetum cinerariifolium TaxID=118510 RepID=A0A699I0C9_TANCI|nr:hypothetical protein [Tanacetum cinerariifolium]